MLAPEVQSLERALRVNKLKCLGHVLHMTGVRLSRFILFYEECSVWKMSRDDGMDTLTTRLPSVGPVRLWSWGPRDIQNDGWGL